MKHLHIHHIVPKHLGGSNDPHNLTGPISIGEHAEQHRVLWEKHGHRYDYIAWKALAGRMTNEEARLAAARVGQDTSVVYKSSRKVLGQVLQTVVTRESCQKGGKAAAPALVAWQKENREQFLRNCSLLGKATGEKLLIAHEYLGKKYPSKKALQLETGLSNTGFYGKLRRGEIIRLGKKNAK